MRKQILMGVVLLSSGLAAQRAVKADKPLTFGDAIKKAESTYASGDYGACVSALQQALEEAMEKRQEIILSALPPAPDGFVEEPQPEKNQAGAALAGLAGLAVLAGQQCSKTYRGEKGAQIKITVLADSAVGGIAAMMFNPVVIQANPKAQLFEYDGGHKAVAKVDGDNVSIDALLGGKHLVQLEGRKITQEQAIEMLNQECMDKIAKAVGG